MKVEGSSLALLILSGDQEGRLLPLKPGEEIVIGRMEGLDLVLPGDLVSRRHARVSVEEEGAVLRDLGSTNGTFVNGKRVREVVLSEGDRILLGSTILSVVPNEEMLLPSASSLNDALASVSAGPPRGLRPAELPDGDGETGAGEEEMAELGSPSYAGEETAGVGTGGLAGKEGSGSPADEETAGAEVQGADFPPGARFALAESAPPLRELAPEALDLLQAALQGHPLEQILVQTEVEEPAARLRELVERGYLRVVDPS